MSNIGTYGPKNAWQQLLQLGDNINQGATSTLQYVQTADGTTTPLKLSTTNVSINGVQLPNGNAQTDYVIISNGDGTSRWGAQSGGGASTLDDLTDVVLTAPASAEYLKYNGSNWVNAVLAGNVSLFTNDAAYTTLAAVAAVGYATATSSTAFTNKTGNISQWTNDSGYLTAETQLAFKTIAVSGQSDIVADSTTDTLTIAAGANITLTTNASTDTLTIASSGGGGLSDSDYGDVTVSGGGTVMTVDSVTVADAAADTTTWPMLSRNVTGANQVVSTDPGLTYDASANSLATTTFVGALTGNASTATALQTARAIGGVNFDGTAAITPANITIANEATDTTCFPLFTTAATGDLPPKSNASLTFNSNTANLSCTTFTGSLAGNASTVTTNANLTGEVTSVGNAAVLDKTAITNRTADASPDATLDYVLTYDDSAASLKKVLIQNLPSGAPSSITIANEATDTTCFPSFFTAATGTLQPKTNANLTYNSNTGAFGTTSLTLTNALTVPNGGTGVASTTAYAVLCGGTTSTGALQSIASVGNAGDLLTSNGAGALPTFQAPGAGSGTSLGLVYCMSTSTYTV